MLKHFEGFYKLDPGERIGKLKDWANLSEQNVNALQKTGSLSLNQANLMIENVVGTMELPVGLGVHFLINGKDRVVPMVIEEPSVVAGASKMAKITRIKGGIHTSSTPSVMIGQIQVVGMPDPFKAKERILQAKGDLILAANMEDPLLVRAGGGAIDIEARVLDTEGGPMLVCHLLVHCQDAMGANAVNNMCESLKPRIEAITQGQVYLRIISNLAVHRLASAKAVFEKESMGGEEIVRRIVSAYHFANADPFRATTHNKGIMNGVTAVALATGQDTRAIEAGAHAYACRDGQYRSLSRWKLTEEGDLEGSLELPMAVGIIGGITNVHPVVRANLDILQVKKSNELGEVMVSVGLVQNAAALRALADEGIQRGHMSLHARNLAIMAGATEDIMGAVMTQLVRGNHVRLDKAQKVVQEVKEEFERHRTLIEDF